MKLNAQDGGKRPLILVKLEDNAGGLTAERVRRASSGCGEGDKAVPGLGLPNIEFWHRNRERRDFKLNGFVNHYPDFIALKRSGNAILVESKGAWPMAEASRLLARL